MIVCFWGFVFGMDVELASVWRLVLVISDSVSGGLMVFLSQSACINPL